MDRNRIYFLLLTAAILCFFCPTLSTAQDNTSSTNPCETTNRCGAYGICDSQSSQICSCLPGFTPNPNNKTGCSRRVPLRCDEAKNASDDRFERVYLLKIPGFSSRLFGNENVCESGCRRDCSCIAYSWDGVIGCMFWGGDLTDIQKLPTGSDGTDLYIRLAKSELGGKKGFTKILIVLVAVGTAFVSIFLYSSWRWMAKRRGRRGRSGLLGQAGGTSDSVDSSLQDAMNEANLEELPLFEFETLANATDNFSEANKLGKGGFGTVYKGQLPNRTKIAVKRLSKASGQGMKEFMNEVVLISKLQHRNLVRLLGCCVENKETMLVYEFMPNKSLDLALFDQYQDILDWRKRFSIIEGICEGLLYLHRDSRLRIIHRDLKPSNILLDNDWNPKISDFGMARIYGSGSDHISTVRVVGTYGYMAPEYAMEGRFSEKSDIFSFGVLMLEIAAGRRTASFHNHPGTVNLLAHVWKLWNEDNVAASIDPRISSPRYQAEVVRCIHIGLLCVQELPKDRPSIAHVLSMLRNEIKELPKPKPPAFALKSNTSHKVVSSSQNSQKSSGSANYITLTEFKGR